MTLLDAVNEILIRLRESEVSSVTASARSKHVRALVNQAKRRVESIHRWSALLHTLSVSTVAGTNEYSLTDWRDRSSIDFIFNTTSNSEIRSTNNYYIQKLRLTNEERARPEYWFISGRDSNGDPTIEVYPTPDAVYTLGIHGYRPQADLTGNADRILVPSYPVVLEAYALAVSERGEDGGATFDETRSQALEALNEAVAIEEANLMQGEFNDWRADLGPRH